MANDSIPTFTPPAPTFTPPKQPTFNGPACAFHPNEPAVTKCARCGKPICQDCADNYQVNDEQYEGKPICYDCCKELVAENVKLLKKQRVKIVLQYIFTLIGFAFGVIIGVSLTSSMTDAGIMTWLLPIICGFVGGCLWTFITNLGKIFANTIKNFANGAWLGGLFWLIIDLVKAIFIAIWGTIQKFFYYTKYAIKTSGFIKSDTRALQQMTDYMEYTQVMSRNVGVDLATLMNEGSELYDNSYAQEVAQHGEAQAEANIRRCVTSINENGEIIRSFAA